MNKSRGYTLVEVLVVIGILATVVLMAAPLTGGWMRDTNVQESEGQLKEAVNRAKSLALRNEMAARGDLPVAAVCLSQARVLTVLKGTAATAPNCATSAGEQIWQAKINEKISIKNNSTAFTCVCFDNKGLVTKGGTCAASCAGSTVFEVAAGSTAETVAIY